MMNQHRLIAQHLIKRSLLSYVLLPISLTYGYILRLRRKIYQRGILKQHSFPVYIISVGNIVSGGTGKTPFTIYLARLLQERGYRVAVSHRGYLSGNDNQATLISNREELLPTADTAGDEAWLIARSLSGIPVVTGRQRSKAIQLLINSYSDLDIVILDDSFQHLRVKHDLDIILMHENIGLGNGFILPSGYLREGLSALNDAQAVVINRTTPRINTKSPIYKQLNYLTLPVFTGYSQATVLYDYYGSRHDISWLRSKKCFLLAAIGNPEHFAFTAVNQKAVVMGRRFYPDHYPYDDEEERQEILENFRKTGAEIILTTEKDYAKLRNYPAMASCLFVLGIIYIPDKANPDWQQWLLNHLPEKV